MKILTAMLFTVALALLAIPAQAAADKVVAGELVIDPPTLINLGFEWLIEGDDNRNARVDVSYRKKGETAWKTAMPLLRLQHERVYQGEGIFNLEMPNMFAGSILDLEENTAKDVKTVQKVYDAKDLDFRLRSGSAAVDHGAVIPNVTDGHSGNAPDLGALESGQPMPHYGPRS